jgi:diguanylate cyclase (GGDEF)-like protein/PAS domain S-box-containing protein
MIALIVVTALALAAIVSLVVWLLRLRFAVQAARTAAEDAIERRFNVLEAVGDGIYIVDEQLRITHVNEEAERLLRTTADGLVGTTLDAVVDPLGSELVPDIRYARRTGRLVERMHAFARTQTWVEIRVKPAATETLVSLRDVTERMRAELLLRANEQRLRLVTHNVDAVLWTTDRDARFTAIAGGALTELDMRAEALIDQSCEVLLSEHLLEDVFAGESLRIVTARGERWLRHHVEPLRDEHKRVVGAVGVSLDITELKRAQQQLFDTAHRDGLTGLPNRLSLEQRLHAVLETATMDDRRFALLYIDLDRFKTINDTLGHGVGDGVLREVAARLRETLNPRDVIARPGGDEFIILLPQIANVGDAEAAAQRVVRAFKTPISVQGRELFISASVGAAVFPEHGRGAEALVGHADAAMYRAKRMGGNRCAFYDAGLESAANDRLTLENDLWHAIGRDELQLMYQPIMDLTSQRMVGCEALVRWNHRVRGMIEPAAFIPIAEETGAIVALDRWVLREACGAAMSIRRTIPDFRIAVNLSSRDLRENDLPDAVADVLLEFDLPPAALTLEITEHAALDDSVLPTLRRLSALGVRVAVDDFGVGYSSLAYLKRLPINGLKIDRAFIADVASDSYDQAIVGSIVTVAKALGLHVTAEGIETEEQIAFITSLGCDEAQGFYFGHPQPFEALERSIGRKAPLRLVHRGA